MQVIKVSLDGGATYQVAPEGVRIIYENVEIPGEDEPGELHVNATSEGIITDVWAKRDEDPNLATRSEELDGIVHELIGDCN